jgi:hypothetical protein
MGGINGARRKQNEEQECCDWNKDSSLSRGVPRPCLRRPASCFALGAAAVDEELGGQCLCLGGGGGKSARAATLVGVGLKRKRKRRSLCWRPTPRSTAPQARRVGPTCQLRLASPETLLLRRVKQTASYPDLLRNYYSKRVSFSYLWRFRRGGFEGIQERRSTAMNCETCHLNELVDPIRSDPPILPVPNLFAWF